VVKEREEVWRRGIGRGWGEEKVEERKRKRN
jgi:hypothetical protein